MIINRRFTRRSDVIHTLYDTVRQEQGALAAGRARIKLTGNARLWNF